MVDGLPFEGPRSGERGYFSWCGSASAGWPCSWLIARLISAAALPPPLKATSLSAVNGEGR